MSMSEMRPSFQFAVGIFFIILYVGMMLWVTGQIYKYVDPDLAPIFTLVTWGGGAMPLLGIWSAIWDSTGGIHLPSRSEPPLDYSQPSDKQSSEPEPELSGARLSGQSQILKPKETYTTRPKSEEKLADDSYRGEMPKRKRKGYDGQ